MSQGPNVPFDPATTLEHSPEQHDATRPLVLPPAMRRQIVQHLVRWLPYEGCGLIATVAGPSADAGVHFFPGSNRDLSETRFTMEPSEVVDAMRQMRRMHWTLGAIVHSHPRSPASLSHTDRREAYYPEARLIIVSLAGAQPEFGCWARTRDPEAPDYRRTPLLFPDR